MNREMKASPNVILGLFHWWQSLGVSPFQQSQWAWSVFISANIERAREMLQDLVGDRTRSTSSTNPVHDILALLPSLSEAHFTSLSISLPELIHVSRDIMNLNGNNPLQNAAPAPVVVKPPNVEPFCQTCAKPFSSTNSLNCHERKYHSVEKGFVCSSCGDVFGSRKLLNNHERRKHGPHANASIFKPYPCETCGKSFSRRNRLREHIERMHDKSMQKFECPVPGCLTRFTSKWCLERHVSVVHKKEKPYVCKICAQRFGLKHHLKLHTERKHETQDEIDLVEESLNYKNII